jgi:hypothetical protein
MKVQFIEILVVGGLVGFTVAFVVSLVFVKWSLHYIILDLVNKIRGRVECRGKWSSMINICYFCVCFWLSFAITLVYSFAIANGFEWSHLLIPAVATIIGVHAKLPG